MWCFSNTKRIIKHYAFFLVIGENQYNILFTWERFSDHVQVTGPSRNIMGRKSLSTSEICFSYYNWKYLNESSITVSPCLSDWISIILSTKWICVKKHWSSWWQTKLRNLMSWYALDVGQWVRSAESKLLVMTAVDRCVDRGSPYQQSHARKMKMY